MSLLKKSKLFKVLVTSGLSVLSVAAISTGIGSNESISKINSSNHADVKSATNNANSSNKTTASTGMSSSQTNNNFTANNNTSIDNSKLTIYPFDMSTNSATKDSGGSGTSYKTDEAVIPSIVQNTAYDDTTNTGYASFVKYDGKDAIAKFLSTPVTTTNNSVKAADSGSTTKYPGSTQWVVTSEQLITIAYNALYPSTTSANNQTSREASSFVSANNYNLTFKSMLYSSGGNSSPPSLFVIASIKDSSTSSKSASNPINGSFLFQINWATTTNTSMNGDKNAGSYRLAAVLSRSTNNGGASSQAADTTTDFIDYNFLVMDGVSTNTMEVLQLGDLTNSNSITSSVAEDSGTTTDTNYSGYYVVVSNSIFEGNASSGSSSTATAHKLTLPNDQLKSVVTENKTYKPIFVSNINSRFFLIFQKDDKTIDNKSYLLVRTDLLTNSLNSDITISSGSNYKNLDFSKLQPSTQTKEVSSKKFETLIYYNSKISNSVATINVVLSIPGQSKYGYAAFDAISFTETTSPTIYDGFATTGFITQIVPYYALNDSNIHGYYALTSTNQVLKLDTSFKYISEVYDFSSSIYKVGSIYKIFTLSGEASTTWYAQMTNGYFAKMSGSNLIGQWDSLYTTDSYEKAGDFTIKSQDEVDSSVFFRKVVNDDGKSFDSSFLSYIGGSSIWKEFLNVVSTDGQITSGDPNISVEIYKQSDTNYYFGNSATNKLEKDSNNTITLVFTQNLRKINAGGSIDSSETTPIIIGSYSYTFYYGEAKINSQVAGTYNYTDYSNYVSQSKLSIPQYVLDMYPSKIASLINSGASGDSDNYNFISSFLKMENIVNPNITATGNDTNGVLVVNVVVPYIWQSNASSATANAVWTFTFGSTSSPFFKYNPFGFSDASNLTSNASVTPIDQSYATSHQTKMNSLKEKYSTVLPSQLSKKDYYDNFLVLGSAFSNSSNISSGLIELPTNDVETNITVVPDDAQGNAFVSITFPKIGPDTDYTISFTTPSIFMKDSSASQSVYFSWKSSSQVTKINNTNSVSDLKPSSVASTFNATNPNNKDLLSMLGNFAIFSDYYSNLITQGKIVVSADYDDKEGFLTINLKVQNGTSIPGIENSNLSMTYTGFKKDASSSSNNITSKQTNNFSWGTYSADSSKSPSSVTVSDLLSSDLLKNNTNLSTWITNGLATVTVTPSNASGTLGVTVTLKNYSNSGTISPIKTFTKTIGGFASTNQNTNMIVWKTNTNASFQSNGSAKLPSAIVTAATSGNYGESSQNYLYNRLTYFANISSDLDATLKANPDQIKSITLQPSDSEGTLIVTAVIEENGISVVYSTTITGLGTTSSLQPTITFNADDATTNNTALNSLREMTPSSITTTNSQLLSLFNVTDSSGNYVTTVDLSYDDYGGSLTVTVNVTDPSTNTVLTTSTKTYTGFAKTVDTSVGTNWGVVAASIIVPLIVLLVPVVLYGYIQQRKDMKTISSRLSTRLKEEQDRERLLKRKQELLRKIK